MSNTLAIQEIQCVKISFVKILDYNQRILPHTVCGIL